MNLVSVDVETISVLFTYLQNLLWSAHFQIIVSMAMLNLEPPLTPNMASGPSCMFRI